MLRIIKYLFFVILFAVFLYLILGQLLLPSDINSNEHICEDFESEWYRILGNGEKIPVEIPGNIDAQRNEEVIIETVLKEKPADGKYLCFRSMRQDMEIYIDGELRKEYPGEGTRFFGKTAAPAFVFVLLKPEDEGKSLTVVTKTDSEYSGTFGEILYGDEMGIWSDLLEEYETEIVVGVIMFLAGIFTAVMSLIIGYSSKKFELAYLGIGLSLAATWILMNSSVRDYYVSNVSVASNMAFFAVMLIPAPFMLYLNYVQEYRYNKQYCFMLGIELIDMIVCTALYIANVNDFSDTMLLMSLVDVAAVILIAGTIVTDAMRGHIKQYKLVAVGILATGVSGVVQIVLYFQRNPFMQGVIIAVGLIFLMITANVKTMRDFLNIEREKQQAISANESKSQFLANMSHEIRTPINAVLGMDEIILRETKDENIREYAKDIQSAGRSLLSLINDILDFSKIESGKMEIIPAEYDIGTLINDSYNMIAMRAREKNLRFKLRNNPDVPRKLIGDEVRVRQIVVNILTNAVKYTKEGSVTLSVGYEDIDDNKIMLKISVLDTGMGIKKEDQDKLFNTFQRADMIKNRTVEGTGLGLAITKQIVDLMGGKIYLKSEYGKGSIFYVDIPQEVASKEPIGYCTILFAPEEEVSEATERSFETLGGNILVVDDVAINLKVIVGLLKNSRLRIDTALSGAECLKLTEEKKYDLIFLDHMMPGMDGVETFEKLKASGDNPNRNTPVIMLTANAIMGAKDEYLAGGFSDYLSKPVQRVQLENMIKKYIQAKN